MLTIDYLEMLREHVILMASGQVWSHFAAVSMCTCTHVLLLVQVYTNQLCFAYVQA